MALCSSFGFCFLIGWMAPKTLFFADIHPIIPFLLLGIGVDDMFVIVKVLSIRCTHSKFVIHKYHQMETE